MIEKILLKSTLRLFSSRRKFLWIEKFSKVIAGFRNLPSLSVKKNRSVTRECLGAACVAVAPRIALSPTDISPHLEAVFGFDQDIKVACRPVGDESENGHPSNDNVTRAFSVERIEEIGKVLDHCSVLGNPSAAMLH